MQDNKPKPQAVRNSKTNGASNEPLGPEDAELKATRIAIGKSVLLHSVIVASILISINFSSKPLVFAASMNAPAESIEIVQATFIDSNVIEQKRREKAQAEAAAQERIRQQQQAERDKAERARKKRAEDARKKRQEALQKEQQKEQERINALEEQRLKEQASEQKRAEQARKKREQEERQKQLEQEMAEQLEKEQSAMAAAQQKQVMTEVEKYNALIMQKVRRNLTLDGGFKNKSCTVNIKLASSGLVLAVNAIEGDPALCRAAQTAVLKAETLPMSPDPAVYEKLKNTNMIIRPNQ